MRKVVIDLDWLDAEITEYKRVINEELVSDGISSIYNHILNTLVLVRSKCEPIEEPFILEVEGMVTTSKEPLPPKCLLDWESAKYCHNDNACELCKTTKE